MQIIQIPVELGGWDGAPGFNIIHMANVGHVDWGNEDWAETALEVEGFYANVANRLADGITVTVPQEVKVLNDDTGNLVGFVNRDETPAAIVGSGGATAARATMALLRLHTGDIRLNRRVQGRLFFGPIPKGAINTAGGLDTTVGADLAAEFQAICDPLSARVVVWARPSVPRDIDGQGCDVTSVSYWSDPAVLRSRRD